MEEVHLFVLNTMADWEPGFAIAHINRPMPGISSGFRVRTVGDDRTPGRADWARLSAGWRQDLDRRIAQLQRLRDDLTECIGCGCLSIDRCRLANPGDVLGREGPGPRRLL